jgi:hypothetical protein
VTKHINIRLDENVANRIARAVMELTGHRDGYKVSYVRHGDGSTDPDWIKKFAEEDGAAIVSGDYNILQHWPNLVAYTESGLISFFPPYEFRVMGGFAKAAFYLRWFPAILEKIRVSERGDRWRLPMIWVSTDHMKMEPIKDPRVDGKAKDEGDTTQATQESLDLSPEAEDTGKG